MTKKQILEDPSISYWVKEAVKALDERDTLDAFYDAEIVLQFAKEKYEKLANDWA